MSFALDPKEVLMHLHELGYYNITPEQLNEFIKDLEKLIQHDITKRNMRVVHLQSPEDSVSSPLPNTTDESISSSPPPPSELPQHHAVGKRSNVVERVSCSSSESSLVPGRRVLRECTKHLSQKNQERENPFRNKSADASKASSKPIKTCDCAWRRIGCKCCEELMSQEQNTLKTKSKENLAPPRPKSSFIRTWQTQAGSYRTQRCDPVALYQQYQQVWKQQKLPGEDNHNDLRWSVRERLLGQQPLPRSCSCDCKCPCKLNEKDFSKNPKKVSSKILPRGPFHIEGRIFGPIGHRKDGEFEVSDSRLRGVIEVGSDSGEDKHTSGGSALFNHISSERAVWLSKKDIDKVKESKGERNENKSNEISCCMTEEEIESRRRNHNRSTCKYCGLIHYMLSSSEGSDTNDKSVRNAYPRGKTGSRPNFDLRRKDFHENELDKNKNLPREGENKKQSSAQCGSKVQIPDKNKSDGSSRGYWHEKLSRSDANKDISSGRNLECSGSHRHQRFAPSPLSNRGETNNRMDSVDSSPPREQWPRQFTVQADVHRQDASTSLSPGSRSTRPTSTPVRATPDSLCKPNNRSIELISHSPTSPVSDRRDCRPVLNLATAASTAQKTSQRQSDSYFETRIPVSLKGFQGEVKTEVEVHKRQKHEESKSPLVTVATKPPSQASSVSSVSRQRKWL